MGNRFKNLHKIAFLILALCVAMPVTSQPARAQACPPGDVDDGNDPAEGAACELPTTCDHDDMRATVMAAVRTAIQEIKNENPNNPDILQAVPPPADNCGPGLIVERAVKDMNAQGIAIGLLQKTGGNKCNNHSVDFVAFPDGCIYDVLRDAGGANDPTFSLDCCGPAPADGGDGTCSSRYLGPGGGNQKPPPSTPVPPGACGPEDWNRANFIQSRIDAGMDGQTICDQYNATYTDLPANDCYARDGSAECAFCLSTTEFYFAPPDNGSPAQTPADIKTFTTHLRVCDDTIPWPSDWYCTGVKAGPPICTP